LAWSHGACTPVSEESSQITSTDQSVAIKVRPSTAPVGQQEGEVLCIHQTTSIEIRTAVLSIRSKRMHPQNRGDGTSGYRCVPVFHFFVLLPKQAPHVGEIDNPREPESGFQYLEK
jgi:hypothetical protein